MHRSSLHRFFWLKQAKVDVASAVFCIALVALCPLSGRTVYRCLISGEYHHDYCCKAKVDCCGGPGGCEQINTFSPESLREHDGESCGCCEVLYRSSQAVGRSDREKLPDTRQRPVPTATPNRQNSQLFSSTPRALDSSYQRSKLSPKIPLYVWFELFLL